MRRGMDIQVLVDVQTDASAPMSSGRFGPTLLDANLHDGNPNYLLCYEI